MNETLYTVQEVADHLRVSRQAIYKWINLGKLSAVKVGEHTRIPKTAVERFIRPIAPRPTPQHDQTA